jgi:hypothetical protein
MEKSLHAKVPDEDFEDKDQDDRQAQKVLDKHVVFDNPVVITERRQKRNFNRLIEKGRLQSQYQRNAMIVDEAFQVIKTNSGVQNIDEIVTTFLKSEEQNYALYNYVGELG